MGHECKILVITCSLAVAILQGCSGYIFSQTHDSDLEMIDKTAAEKIWKEGLTEKEARAIFEKLPEPPPKGEPLRTVAPGQEHPSETAFKDYELTRTDSITLFILIPFETVIRAKVRLYFREGMVSGIDYEGPDGKVQFRNP
jgi:hypothetical protein